MRFLTVFSARNSRSAICRLVSPSPISRRISRSRGGELLQFHRPAGRGSAQPGHHPGGRAGVEHGAAAGHGAHRRHQIGSVDLLEHIAGGAGHDGVEERLVVVEGRQHQTGEVGEAGPQLPADLDPFVVPAVARGAEPYVEHRDPGPYGGGAGEGLAGVRRLADHLQIGLGVEQIAQSAPHHLVVVEQKDPDGAVGVGCLGHGLSSIGARVAGRDPAAQLYGLPRGSVRGRSAPGPPAAPTVPIMARSRPRMARKGPAAGCGRSVVCARSPGHRPARGRSRAPGPRRTAGAPPPRRTRARAPG